jgi:lysozyme
VSFLEGIDVSNHQGVIAWGAVAGAGVGFAFLKASEGTTFRDPFLATNRQGALANGIPVGYYHFARPGYGNDPIDEADFFLETLAEAGAAPIDGPVALDLEDLSTQHDLRDWAIAWLERVAGRSGRYPLLYSGLWYLGPRGLVGEPALARAKLWLASYVTNRPDSFPEAPPPWDRVTIFQWSDRGVVPGISGFCDLDLFDGTVEEFQSLGLPTNLGAGGTGGGSSDPRSPVDPTLEEETRQRLAEIKDLTAGLRRRIRLKKAWADLDQIDARVDLVLKVLES